MQGDWFRVCISSREQSTSSSWKENGESDAVGSSHELEKRMCDHNSRFNNYCTLDSGGLRGDCECNLDTVTTSIGRLWSLEAFLFSQLRAKENVTLGGLIRRHKHGGASV